MLTPLDAAQGFAACIRVLVDNAPIGLPTALLSEAIDHASDDDERFALLIDASNEMSGKLNAEAEEQAEHWTCLADRIHGEECRDLAASVDAVCRKIIEARLSVAIPDLVALDAQVDRAAA